jgi:hypothetical protein
VRVQRRGKTLCANLLPLPTLWKHEYFSRIKQHWHNTSLEIIINISIGLNFAVSTSHSSCVQKIIYIYESNHLHFICMHPIKFYGLYLGGLFLCFFLYSFRILLTCKRKEIRYAVLMQWLRPPLLKNLFSATFRLINLLYILPVDFLILNCELVFFEPSNNIFSKVLCIS